MRLSSLSSTSSTVLPFAFMRLSSEDARSEEGGCAVRVVIRCCLAHASDRQYQTIWRAVRTRARIYPEVSNFLTTFRGTGNPWHTAEKQARHALRSRPVMNPI